MNTKMYENRSLTRNLDACMTLATKEIRLKSGVWKAWNTGRGALADIDDIIESIDNALTK